MNADTLTPQNEGLLHVAIVMDGNGRWAKARGLPRTKGHQQGVETLRKIIDSVNDLGVTHLTVYSFSTENWARPKSEVTALFQLLRMYVEKDLDRLRSEEVRVRVFGSKDKLPQDILSIISHVEESTASNTKFNLSIAFNYGARNEIVQACKRLVESGISPEQITEDVVASHLYTSDLPDPDIVIRTSGEKRLSNFLLWQTAYSEFFYTDTLWPEFSRDEFAEILQQFKGRKRRFGGTTAVSNSSALA